MFEEAYRLEAEDPHRSTELYRQALRRGLEPNLRRTAQVRLNLLSKKTGATRPEESDEAGFDAAVAARELRETGVPAGASDQFFRGLRLLKAPGTAEQPEPYMSFWGPALKSAPNFPALRVAMARALSAAGRADRGLALLDEVDPYNPAYGIPKADLLVQRSRAKDARALLLTLAARYDLNAKDKTRILYLLARIARDQGDTLATVRYFRLAARYGDRGQQIRYRSLAAFSLYRGGMPLQARALMRGIPTKHNRNIHILDLILRVQVDGEKEARVELRGYVPDMRKAADAGRASYLEQRALELMGPK